MTRFYFHLFECGRETLDEEGVLLVDVAAAHKQALAAARSIMGAEIAEGRLCLSCRVEVIDDGGNPAVTIPFKEALELSGV